MRFDIHLRAAVRDRIEALGRELAEWERPAGIDAGLRRKILDAIVPFEHARTAPPVTVTGVDGSGDFPALSFGDSFVYVSVAAAASYEPCISTGLQEVALPFGDLVEFTWLSGDRDHARASLLDSFARLTGRDIESVVRDSDYRILKRSGISVSVDEHISALIVPPAHDAGNVSIQLRTVAELGLALRTVECVRDGALVLTDGTFSLPLAARPNESLFFEHLRRFCCVEARRREVVFAAISKSHGLRAVGVLEELAAEKLGAKSPEHWYLRVPRPTVDGWSLELDGRRLPPPGAVTYLFRLHRHLPVLRFDIDEAYWESKIRAPSVQGTQDAERALFETLDYSSHDQRSFGYPYPIKAAHDRSALTQAERRALRKQMEAAALAAGVQERALRDVSVLTGHA